MNDQGKPWYSSKTIIFNVLSLLVGLAVTFGFGEFEAAEWVGQVQIVITTVINLYLRTITTKPLSA
jgi:uncharacterized membrane protein